MANLLILYGRREPANIMVEEFFVSISDDNNLKVKSINIDDINPSLLEWSDIVMGIRTQNILEADIMTIAKKTGRLVIEMIDDDFLALKDYHIRRPLQKRSLLKALKNADVVLGSNESLVKKYLSYTSNGKFCILHTAVSENEIGHPKENNEEIINIAYYASDGDDENFNRFIRPILKDIDCVLKNPVHWHFFSVHPDMSNTPLANSVTYYKQMPIEKFRKTLSNTNIHIGIAPLIDSEFNKGKYVNKFFEYSRASIPAIYSNVKPYAGFIKNGVTGILANNTKEAWIKAFEMLASEEIRNKIRNESQKELRKKYSVDTIKKSIFQDIPELLYDHNNWSDKHCLIHLKVKKIIYEIMDKPARFMGRIRAEGFYSAIVWLKDHYIIKSM